MNAYTLFITICLLVFTIVAALAVREWLADRWADYEDGARQVTFADIKALPDTTAFDPKPDLPRARLRSVPTPGLRVVPPLPLGDDEWASLLRETDPSRIPEQRDGSAS